jgi:oligoendopeptidase F
LVSAAHTGGIPRRDEIPERSRWNLADIYPSLEAWEADYSALQNEVPGLSEYRGKLGEGAEALLNALSASDRASEKIERLYGYAMMHKDEDNANSTYQALTDRAHSLSVKISGALSYLIPEILALPADTLAAYLRANTELQFYRQKLDEITRHRDHVRSAEVEEVLANSAEVTEAGSNVFRLLNSADLKFPAIKDENGNDVEVSHGRYISFMESPDRRVRKDAFAALYGTYHNYRNTFAGTFSSFAKRNIFYARSRGYASARQAALDHENIPESVYDNLITAVHAHLDSMYRYMRLRKRALGVDDLHMYDVYVPIVPDVDMHMSYEDGLKLVERGLAPLGDKYLGYLREGFTRRWIDVFENQGKTNGAYSTSVYGVHPYVLLNFEDTLDNVFTIAHEMGHALHSLYSMKAQPYTYSDYTLFVAEVASTTNEALLMHYLLDHTTDKRERMYLVNHYLEQFRTTVFRQTMFAEFELKAHTLAEQGEALTPDRLCEVYGDINAVYYGPDMVIDPGIRMEWARIPHFYMNYYVYKYATGFSAATALAQRILKEGQPAVEKYISFLKSGSSMYPIDELRLAGVDMESPRAVEEALKVFDGLVAEMETLLAE